MCEFFYHESSAILTEVKSSIVDLYNDRLSDYSLANEYKLTVQNFTGRSYTKNLLKLKVNIILDGDDLHL